MWSVPEEIREYRWEKRHYPWVGTDLAGLGCDRGIACKLKPKVVLTLVFHISG